MHGLNSRSIIVATMGGDSAYEHILRLETNDGMSEQSRYFSVSGSIFSARTREALMEFAAESLDDMWDDDLRNTNIVARKLAFMGVEPEWEDYELEDMLGDVEAWVDAPDGVEWGLEHVCGGQCVDIWERFIPDREIVECDGYDGRLKPDVDLEINWVIEPNQYGALIDLWRAHHLKRPNEVGYIVTPQWVIELSEQSLSLEQAFARWWWEFQFDWLYFGAKEDYQSALQDGKSWEEVEALCVQKFDDSVRESWDKFE